MKTIQTFIILCLISARCIAQETLYEDREGESSIFFRDGSAIQLNTADASLTISFAKEVSNKKFFYGGNVSGKTNDGLMSFLSEGEITPGVKLNAVAGWKELINTTNHPSLDAWLTFKAGYEGSSFKLYDPDADFDEQITTTSFDAFNTSASFNLKMGGTKLVAISIGYKKTNNYSSLDEVELTEQHQQTDTASGIIRNYGEKITVRTGSYETFDRIPVNLDFFWIPGDDARISIYHYWRTKITDGKTTHGAGSGLYLLKRNNPLAAIAGVVLEVNDLSKLEQGFMKNVAVNFVIGYNFNFN